MRRELGLPEDAFVFGAHGRVLPRKGFAEWLRASRVALDAMTPEERERVFFVLVGDTPEDIGADHVAECKDLARTLGIERHARFLGFRADVRPCLRDFDVEVVPSVYEDPLPRAVIEAMAFGVPVIGTAVGGIGEMLEGGGGILVPARDEAALSDAMLRYLRDGALRVRDGQRARERACAEFDSTAHAARIREQIAIAIFGGS
jgi:glycosyltransferase involved in cell wall biosynthesis